MTEAESEITGRHVVGSGNSFTSSATVAVLAATILVVVATGARRSFAGLGVVAAGAAVGLTWLAFAADDTSTRSTAEIRAGLWVLTASLAVVCGATVLRWSLARVARRRDRTGLG